MSHLDEGTIHAWLDDALPADEAARVEAHARDCAQCAAMVAEARGFIAGASHIVSSLDVVRCDVIPAAAAAPVKPASRGSLWRTLKLTPARAAIAATLLVAVASMLTLRHQDVDLAAPSAPPRADTFAAAAAPEASAAPAALRVDSVASSQKRVEPEVQKQARGGAIASARGNAGRAADVPPSAVAKSTAARADAVSSNGAPPPAARPTASAERKVATAPVTAEPAPAPTPTPAAARPASRDTTVRLMEAVVTASDAARRDTTAAQRANASSARSSVSGAPARDPVSRFARGATGATPQATIEAAALGCYRLQTNPPIDLRGFPAQFRLAFDSTNGGHSVYATNADRDSVLSGASWRVLQARTVVVSGTDTRSGSIQIAFVLDSTKATVRSMPAIADATIQRTSCVR